MLSTSRFQLSNNTLGILSVLDSNGFLGYFIQGQYSYENKDIACQDYINYVEKAVDLSNASYSEWRKEVVTR
jgi:hypothetical protein